MVKGFGRIALGAALASTALMVPTWGYARTQAQAAAQVDFDIPEQPLGDALIAYSRQSGEVVVVSADQVANLRSRAVSGRMAPATALDQLLTGTGLTPRRDRSGGVTLARAQAFQGYGSDEGATPEILVTGSRSLNVDIERKRNDPQPYVVFDAETIRQSQATNVNEFLKTRVPMNAIQLDSGQQGRRAVSTTSQVNLRGLGLDETLILVDGRRRAAPLAQTGNTTDFGQPDINGIPVASIERIEILPSGAGGIYGGGATGGVVNIILKHDYRGFEAGVTYGDSGDFKAPTLRADLSGAFNIGASTNISFSASHQNSGELLVGERSFAARGRALAYANNPGGFTTGLPPLGSTANILNPLRDEQTGAPMNLVLANGTVLKSPFTSVPAGYAATSAAAGSALAANAGQYNLAIPDDQSGLRQTLLAQPNATSLNATINHTFSDKLKAFVDVSYQRNLALAHNEAAPGLYQVLVTKDAANPFVTPVFVAAPTPAVDKQSRYISQALGATGGLVYTIGKDWSASLDHAWSRARGEGRGVMATLTTAGQEAIASGAVNLLGNVPAAIADITPYLTPDTIVHPANVYLNDTNFRLSGPLFRLPGGNLTFSGLIEHRNQRATPSRTTAYVDGTGDPNFFYRPQRSQTVNSLYAELRAPVFGTDNAIPFINRLELQAAVRHDRYVTKSVTEPLIELASEDAAIPDVTGVRNRFKATKYTLAAVWAPMPDIQLRGSYATAFLPPSIQQIVPELPSFGYAFITDPKGSGEEELVEINQIFGGNPNLIPEQSTNWSAGVILMPRFLHNLRLSVDYTKLTKKNEITTLDTDTLLANEDVLGSRVVRANGVITLLDLSLINASRTTVESLDIQGDYSLLSQRLGDFHLYGAATRQIAAETQYLAGEPFVDLVGYDQGQLKWRGNAGLTWSKGGLTLGWNAQYYGSYRPYSAGASASTIRSAVRYQGSDRIPSQTYHDALISYRIGDRGALGNVALSNTTITFGMQNVLNKRPPIVATVDTSGGYSTYGDPRMRRFTLSARESF